MYLRMRIDMKRLKLFLAINALFLSFQFLSQNSSFTTSPAANNNTLSLCEGSQVLFTNTSVGTVNTISWTFQGGSPASSNAVGPHIVTFANPGTFTVSLSVNGGAVTTMQVVISASNPTSNLNLLLDNGCGSGFGTSTFNNVTYFTSCSNNFMGDQLCLYTNTSSTNANSIHTIYWGDGTFDVYNGSNIPTNNMSFQHGYPNAGNAYLTYTFQQNNNSCIKSQIYLLYTGANPTATISPGGVPTLCNPGSVVYDIIPGGQNTPGTTYTISINDGWSTTFPHPPPLNVTHYFTSVSCGTNSVINGTTYPNSFQASITCSNACGSSTSAIGPINIQSAPDAIMSTTPSLSPYNNKICQGSNVTFNDISTPGTNIQVNSSPPYQCNNNYKRIWKLYGPAGPITANNTYATLSGSLGIGTNLTAPGGWTNGSANVNVTFLLPGNYTMTLYVGGLAYNPCGVDSTVFNLCVTPDFQVNIVSPFAVACAPATGVFQNNSTPAQCNLNNVSAWSVSSSNPNQCGQSAWSYVNNTNAQSLNPSLSFTGPGVYTVQLTNGLSTPVFSNTSPLGCQSLSTSVQITIKAPPVAAVSAPANICLGSPFTPTVYVNNCYSTQAPTYAWDFNPNATPLALANVPAPDTSNSQNPGSILYPNAGTFPYTFTTANECGPSTITQNIVVQNPAFVTPGSYGPFCINSPVALNGIVSGSVVTGYWTANVAGGSFSTVGSGGVNSGALNSTYNPPAGYSGSIILTLTSSQPPAPCPIVTGQTTLVFNPVATANANSYPNGLCAGQSLTLNGSIGGAASSGSWTSNVGGTFSNVNSLNSTWTPPVGFTGNAILTLTTNDPSGPCNPAVSTATVLVKPLPVATSPATVGPICSGANAVITLTSSINPSTFAWSTSVPAGVVATANGNLNSGTSTATLTTPVTNNTNSPQTLVYIFVPTANGCAGIADTTSLIVQPVAAIGPFSPITVCPNTTITPPAFVSNPNGATFAWTNTNSGIGLASNGTNQINPWTAPVNSNNNNPGTITGTITVTPTFIGCPGTPASFVVTINPTPTITNNVLSQTICSGSTTALVTWTPSPAGAPTTFNWTGVSSSANLTGFNSSGSGNLPAMAITNSGNTPETVTYSITPVRNGCTGPSITYTITVNPIPVLTLTSNQIICGGQTTAATAFTNSVAGGGFSYVLQNAPPGTVSGHPTNGSGQIPASTINNSGSNPYTLNYLITPSANGCNGSPATYSITVNPAPVTTFSQGNQTICTGQNTSLVNLSSTTPNVTFSWNVQGAIPAGLSNFNPTSGSSSIPIYSNLTNSTAAPITVNIQAQATTAGQAQCPGAPANYSITVNPSPLVNAVFVSNDTLCSGQNINLSLGSTTAGTTFTWTASNGAGISGGQNSISPASTINQTLINNSNAVGNVTYTITPSAASCFGSPISVLAYVNPVASVGPFNPIVVCPNTSITPPIWVSNPNGANFGWVNSNQGIGLASSGTNQINPWNAPSNNTNNPILGTITVTPTFNGCTGSSATLSITINPTPTVTNNSLSQTVCSGAPTVPVTWSSGVAGTTFSWTASGSVNVSGYTTPGSGNLGVMNSLQNLGNVNETITYVVTPTANGCVGPTISYSLIVNPTPVLTLSNNQTICGGTTTSISSFTNSVAGGGFTYALPVAPPASIGGNPTSGNGQVPAATINNTGANPYTLNYTVTPVANGCSGATGIYSITVNPAPVTTFASANQAICSGANTTAVLLNSTTPNVSFTWQANVPGGVNNFNPTNASGNLPVFSGLINTTNTVQTVQISATASTTGTVCMGPPAIYSISIIPIPTVNAISNATYCNNSAIPVTAITSNVANASFVWSMSPAIGLNPANGTSATIPGFNATINSSIPVNSTVTITPTVTSGATSCTGTAGSFIITVNPTPAVTQISPQVICAGNQSMAITIGGPVNGTIYNWTNNNTLTGLGASGSVTIPAVLGTNSTSNAITSGVTITPSYSNNNVTCVGSNATYNFTVNPVPLVASLPNQQVCSGSQVNLNFSSPNNIQGVVYNWTNSNTSIGLGASNSGNISFTSNNSTNGPISGSIIVTPSFTNAGISCPGIPDTVVVTVLPTPVATALTPQILCSGSNSTAINFSSNQIGTQFNWTNTNPNIGLLASGAGDIPSFQASNLGTSSISGTLSVLPSLTTNGQACVGAPVSTQITIQPNPVINIPTAGHYCHGSSVNYAFTSNIANNVSYTWTNTNPNIGLNAAGNGSVVFTAQNTTTAPLVGTVTVTPTFTSNGISCAGSPQSFTIEVIPNPGVNPVNNLTMCTGDQSSAISFSSPVANTTFNWTNANSAIGLASSGQTTVPVFIATNASTSAPLTSQVSVVASVTVNNTTCSGSPMVFNITVNPNSMVNAVNNITLCTGVTTSQIAFSGTGTGYTWLNNNTSIGLNSSGTGNIAPFVVTNSTTSPISGSVTVTSVYTGGGISCNGSTTTFNITVNPTPSVTAPSNVVLCNGSVSTAISLNGTGTGYNWTNSTPGIGLNATGSGNIPSFTAINNTANPIIATINITPVYLNNNVSCPGSVQTFTITVNPAPQVNFSIPNQTICAGTSSSAVTISSPTPGAVITWNATNVPAAVSGVTNASGGNSIPSFNLSNSSTAAETVQFTVNVATGGALACPGGGVTYTITVNPAPSMTTPTNQVICANSPTAAVSFVGNANVYNWSNNTTSIGLSASGTGNLASFTALNNTANIVTATVTITPQFLNNNVGCNGVSTTFTLTVNPIPNASAISNQTWCNGINTTAVTLGGTGTSYSWSNNNQNIGLGASGSTTVPVFQATNPGSAPISGIVTVIPTFTNLGIACIGPATNYTITVNPTPGVTAVANQVVCNNSATTLVNFSGTATAYNWSNNNPLVGLAASNTGNIPSFNAINASNSTPTTAGITVTPVFLNNNVTCPGTPINFTYTINPTPVVSAVSNQVVCNGASTTLVAFSGTATQYNWTNSNTSIGLIGAGSGNINTFTAVNATINPIVAQLTVTPAYTGQNLTCQGSQQVFSITVNPSPSAAQPSNQVVCNGQATSPVNFTGTATSYNWTNDLTSIGLIASSTGNIATFNAVNNTNSPVTATISVIPVFTGANLNCPGVNQTFTITVNPTPTMAALSNQVLCSGTSTSAVNFTGSATSFTWINNTPAVGLNASGTGNIASFQATNASNSAALTATISATPQFANAGLTCPGATQTMTITVNPIPVLTASPNVTYCNGTSTPVISFNGTANSYAWTNSLTSIGLAASGPGNLPVYVATNPGINPVTSTVTVTPIFTANGLSCNGAVDQFDITVNPTPSLVAISNQTVCNGSSTSAVSFTGGVAGTVFNWTNNAPAIGLGASGSGNIAAFNAINNGNNPIIAQINVTPVYSLNGVSCSGTAQSFTITVNATPTVNFNLSNQTLCSQGASNTVIISSPTNGANISWTAPNVPNSILGMTQTSGNATIPTFTLTNTSPTPQTIQILASATTAGNVVCPGGGTPYTITVNPTPTVSTPANQVLCHNSASTQVVFSGTGTSYTWLNNLTSIGLAASGTGTIPSFNVQNPSSTTPVAATISVTPQFTNNNVTCPGPVQTFSITVNPIPVVNAQPNVTYCNGSNSSLITINGTGTAYAWTNSTTSIGLASSGNGNILPFSATNLGVTPVVATIGLTPSYTNLGVTCYGNLSNFNFIVNPTPTVNGLTNQVICNNSQTSLVSFSGSATAYLWTNNSPSIGLGSSGSGNIPVFNALNASNSTPSIATVTVTPQFTNNGVACTGSTTNFTITVNPTPVVTAPSSQTLCNGANTTQVLFTGTGTSYSWTNSIPTIGIGASGTGTINSFVATNNGINPITAQFVVTPVFTGSAVACSGQPQNFSITINPTPNVQIPSNQVVCNGNLSNAVNFTGNGTSYSWSNSNPSIGLNATGTGNIASFTSTNATQVPVTATITVSPNFAGGNASCPGSPQNFTITVNPTPNVDPLVSQVLCNGSSTIAVNFSGTGTSYAWSNNAPNIGLGANGVGNISSFTATNPNNANPLVGTITTIPQYLNAGLTCSGAPQLFTITVNPTPVSNPINNITVCNGSNTPVVNFTGTGTSYTWTNNNNTIGLVPNGTGTSLASFQAINQSAQSVSSQINVTAIYTGNGLSCTGTTSNFNIYVSPTPTVNVPSNQVACNGSSTNAVNFTGLVPGTTFNWTNSISTIGIAATGTGNIPAFNAINNGNAAVFAQIITTPVFIQNSVSCPGTPQSFTYQVNPTPSVTNPGSQYVCSGNNTTALTFVGSGTSYPWSAANPSIGIGANGVDNIPSFIGINNSNVPISSQVTVTPIFTQGIACSGQPQTFSYFVLPIPSVSPIANQNHCPQVSVPALNINGSGTSYNWTNSNTGIGLVNSGSNIINGFNATNPGINPLTGAISVTPIYTFQGQSCNGPVFNFAITVNPLPYVNNLNDTIICNHQLTSINIGTNIPANITWFATQNNNVNGELTTVQTSNFIQDSLSNLSNGIQFVTYTITPTTQAGCTGPDSTITVQVQPDVLLNIPQNLEICSGAGVNAILGANIPSNFSWFCTLNNPNVSGESLITNTGSVINDVLINNSNQNQVVVYAVTPTSIQGNCSGPSQTITVIVKPPLALLNQDTVTICSGDNVNLTLIANTNVTFNWYADPNVNVLNETTNITTGGVINDALVNPTGAVETVSYHVIGTSVANGCSSPVLPVTVFVNPIPIMTPVLDIMLCNAQWSPQVLFTGTVSGAIYNWSSSGSSIGMIQNGGMDSLNAFVAINNGFAPLSSTVFVSPIFTFNAVSCLGSQDTFLITVNPEPTVFQVSNVTLCEATNSTVVPLIGPIGGTTFTWVNSNAAVGLASTGSGNIPVFTAQNPTSAAIQSTVTITPNFVNGNYQCPGQDITYTITVNPTPNVLPQDATICSNETLALNLVGDIPSTFQWYATANPNVINETYSPVQATGIINDLLIQNTNVPQTVQYHVTAISVPFGCVGPDSIINVIVNPLPNVAFNPINPPFCDLSPISFQNNSSPGFDYEWNFGDGGVSYLTQPTNQYPGVGTYNVSLIVTNPNTGCVDSANQLLSISPTPNPDFTYSDSIGCGLLDVIYTAAVYNPSWNYVWNFGNGTSTQQVGQVGYQFIEQGCYDISLTVTNPQGCTATELNYNVACVYENPIAVAGAEPTVVNTIDPLVSFSNNSENASSYEWNFGDGTFGFGFEPIHVFPGLPADYVVSLIATNEVGCNDTAYVSIHVEENVIYYVPNTFTPNDDEKNQVFKPILSQGFKPGTYQLRIYNRWGQLIFESRDAEVGWNGDYGPSSINCQSGTYTWVLNFQVLQTQEDKEITGHVNLIK